MSDYNYSNFSSDHYELQNFSGPVAGTKAPNGRVTDLNGEERDLLDFKGDFLVLETGSITCPLFQSRRGGMRAIVLDYPDLAYRILYVREAHPGSNIPAHTSIDDKMAHAKTLRDTDKEGRQILIDSMDGAAHAAYGSFPNALYIINKNGCVVYRSAWSNPNDTRRAIEKLLAGKSARSGGLFLPALPPVAVHTLRQSGKGAALDFLKSFPSLIWNNLIRYNLRVLLGRGEKARADTSC